MVELEGSYLKGCRLCSVLLANIRGNQGTKSKNRLRTAMRDALSTRNTAISIDMLIETLSTELQRNSSWPQITKVPEDVEWLSSDSIRQYLSVLNDEQNDLLNSSPQMPLFVRISPKSPRKSSLTDGPIPGRPTIYQPGPGRKPELEGMVEIIKSKGTTDQHKRALNQFLLPVRHIAAVTWFTNSLETFDLVQIWVNHCLRNHLVCSSYAELSFDPPTRVIDVGPLDGSQIPRIHISSDADKNMRCLTPSHCWGDANVAKLMQSNYKEFLSGFSGQQLPSTCQDAIYVARRLNQRYLWIDSLCIIQDNDQDWQKEARMMSRIYQSSICTIAASAADNSFAGCFVPRNPLAYQPCVLPGDLGLRTSPRPYYRDFDPPLHFRAWVLQERLLCARTLRFGSAGIEWECQQCEASDQFPCGVPRYELDCSDSNLMAVFTDLQRPLPSSLISEEDTRRFLTGWQEIVQIYSELNINLSSDEFIAFAGVVERIQRSTRFWYYFGLWLSFEKPSLFLLELLWFADYPLFTNYPEGKFSHIGAYTTYVHKMRTPFSWASIDGDIDYSTALHDRIVNEGARRVFGNHNGWMGGPKGGYLSGTFRNQCAIIQKGDPYENPFSRKMELRSRLCYIREGGKGSEYNGAPSIVLEGRIRKVELRTVPSKPGTRKWEDSFPESLVPTSETGPRRPEWLRNKWFFPDMDFYAHIDCEVLCLTIVRWQRDWNLSWYSAGLILVEEGSKEVQVNETLDIVKFYKRIGYFEFF